MLWSERRGHRVLAWLQMPSLRMGPPPRSLLPMRIPASWSGPWARRIQGCGTSLRAPARSSPRRRHPDHSKCAVVLGALKAKPFGGRPMGGPALTAPARAGVRTWRSGRGKACGAVELEKFELDNKERSAEVEQNK